MVLPLLDGRKLHIRPIPSCENGIVASRQLHDDVLKGNVERRIELFSRNRPFQGSTIRVVGHALAVHALIATRRALPASLKTLGTDAEKPHAPVSNMARSQNNRSLPPVKRNVGTRGGTQEDQSSPDPCASCLLFVGSWVIGNIVEGKHVDAQRLAIYTILIEFWNAQCALERQIRIDRRELRIRAGKEFQPIRPVRRIKPGSALDFSRFLDAPAGKYGFVRAVNGRLEFSGRPGHEFRFYGSNLCFSANFPEHATAVQIAEEFASTGYNIVRFHHYDNQLASRKAGTVLDPEMLDRMEFLMAEMKKRGIYSTIDLYVSRRFRPGEIAALPAGGSGGNAKGMIFFDDEAFENWKRFSEALLNHVNPYTGLAWKDDPALISISLVNEDTIYLAANAKYVKPLVAERFQEYVKKNRITLTDENHRRMKLKFLSEVYRARYAQMREFLRELGVRVPLTDQNSYASLPLALMGEEYDLIDTHTYAGYPKFLNGGWTPPAQIMPGSILAVCGDEFPRKGAQACPRRSPGTMCAAG